MNNNTKESTIHGYNNITVQLRPNDVPAANPKIQAHIGARRTVVKHSYYFKQLYASVRFGTVVSISTDWIGSISVK